MSLGLLPVGSFVRRKPGCGGVPLLAGSGVGSELGEVVLGNRLGRKVGAAVVESDGIPVGTSSQSRHSHVAKVGSKNKLSLLLLLSSSLSLSFGQKPVEVPSINL